MHTFDTKFNRITVTIVKTTLWVLRRPFREQAVCPICWIAIPNLMEEPRQKMMVITKANWHLLRLHPANLALVWNQPLVRLLQVKDRQNHPGIQIAFSAPATFAVGGKWTHPSAWEMKQVAQPLLYPHLRIVELPLTALLLPKTRQNSYGKRRPCPSFLKLAACMKIAQLSLTLEEAPLQSLKITLGLKQRQTRWLNNCSTQISLLSVSFQLFSFQLSSLKYLESLRTCLEDTIPLLERTTDWCKSQLIHLTNQLNHETDLKVRVLSSLLYSFNIRFFFCLFQAPININIKQLKELNTRMNSMMQNPKVDPLPKDDMINHELIRRIDRLQEQNRMLTCEVSRQSNRVTALEHDKRSLIKQLFQHSSSNSLNSNASTLRWNNLCHSIFCESTHSHLENWLYLVSDRNFGFGFGFGRNGYLGQFQCFSRNGKKSGRNRTEIFAKIRSFLIANS